jgi:hypothetical protein
MWKTIKINLIALAIFVVGMAIALSLPILSWINDYKYKRKRR